MAAKSVQYFKDLFKTGYVITQQDYADWLDSFRSSLIGVPLSDTTGLDNILSAYRKTADKVPVADIDGLTAFVNNLTANFLTTSSMIEQAQIVGLVDALSEFVTAQEVLDLIASAVASVTPSIGGNGNWFVGGSDTGVKAQGEKGATPSINSSGNWEIDGVDTDVRANAARWIDDNSTIIGLQDEDGGRVLTGRREFWPESFVFTVDGVRMSLNNDYTINDNHKSITSNRALNTKNIISFDYIPK